jgi:hypothetical protein
MLFRFLTLEDMTTSVSERVLEKILGYTIETSGYFRIIRHVELGDLSMSRNTVRISKRRPLLCDEI